MEKVIKRLVFKEKALKVFGLMKKPGISYQAIFDQLVEAEWNRINKKRAKCPF